MPLKNAAKKYRLPAEWLETQAKNGSLSCLIAGPQILFDEKLLLRELARKVGKQQRNNNKGGLDEQ